MREHIFHIKSGAITNKATLKKAFAELKDGRYLIRISSIKQRSLQQNAYLHGVVIPLVFEGLRDAGFEDVRDVEDAKDIIKTLFLKRRIINKSTGEVIEITRNTSELTTVEMMAFIEDVARWAAEYLGVVIPEPNTQLALYE